MRRFAIVCAGAGIALVVAASPAWGHVKINPSVAPKGSDAVLAFVVPNEESNATTTKIVVQFPHDHPIADALTQPIAGWTAKVAMFHTTQAIQTDSGPVNDAVDTVTWTAQGPGVPVGAFQEFSVSVGLPGDASELQFPTVQTYSDGKTVSWVQQTPPGGPEPDNPVPVLTLTSGTGGSSATATTTSTSSSSDDSAKTIAIIGLIVGAIGLIVAIVAIVTARRKPSASAPSA